MSCNCNTANPNCEPCAICTPPGVVCLPDCDPKDPCEQKIDLCCVRYTGEDQPCSGIYNGDPLCDILPKFLGILFPPSSCCQLQLSIDIIPNALVTTTTTTARPTTSTTTTTTRTTSTTTSSTSTTSTTTTTTPKPPVSLCYDPILDNICDCLPPIN